MKKNTIKTLVLITVILFGLTQANAVVDVVLADKLTNSIWSNEQVNELSKDDTIVKLAWSIQEEVVDIQNENYEIVACAADMETKDKSSDLTKAIWSESNKFKASLDDKISNLAWSYQDNNKVLSSQDSITNVAWSSTDEVVDAQNESYEIIACAAEM